MSQSLDAKEIEKQVIQGSIKIVCNNGNTPIFLSPNWFGEFGDPYLKSTEYDELCSSPLVGGKASHLQWAECVRMAMKSHKNWFTKFDDSSLMKLDRVVRIIEHSLSTMGASFRSIQSLVDNVSAMKQGDILGILGGWRKSPGHAVMYLLERKEKNSFNFVVSNSAGSPYGEYRVYSPIYRKSQTDTIISDIPTKRITNYTFWTYLCLINTVNHPNHGSVALYDLILTYLANDKLESSMDKNFSDKNHAFKTTQRSGTCFYRAILHGSRCCMSMCGLNNLQIKQVAFIVRRAYVKLAINDLKNCSLLDDSTVRLIRIGLKQAARAALKEKSRGNLTEKLSHDLTKDITEVENLLKVMKVFRYGNEIPPTIQIRSKYKVYPFDADFTKITNASKSEELFGNAQVKKENNSFYEILKSEFCNFKEFMEVLKKLDYLCKLTLGYGKDGKIEDMIFVFQIIYRFFTSKCPLPNPPSQNVKGFWENILITEEESFSLLSYLKNFTTYVVRCCDYLGHITKNLYICRATTLGAILCIADYICRIEAFTDKKSEFADILNNYYTDIDSDLNYHPDMSQFMKYMLSFDADGLKARCKWLEYFGELKKKNNPPIFQIKTSRFYNLKGSELQFAQTYCKRKGIKYDGDEEVKNLAEIFFGNSIRGFSALRYIVIVFKLFCVHDSDMLDKGNRRSRGNWDYWNYFGDVRDTATEDPKIMIYFGIFNGYPNLIMCGDISNSILNPEFYIKKIDKRVKIEECDILYEENLPKFEDALSLEESEQVLSMLTTPYISCPLLLNFFSMKGRASLLRNQSIRALLEMAMFRIGIWVPEKKSLPSDLTIPYSGDIGTPYGYFINDLVYSHPVIIIPLLEISDFVFSRINSDEPNEAILFVVRTLSRTLNYIVAAYKIYELEHLLECYEKIRDMLHSRGIPILMRWKERAESEDKIDYLILIHAHIVLAYASVPHIRMLTYEEGLPYLASQCFLRIWHQFGTVSNVDFILQKNDQENNSAFENNNPLKIEELELFDATASCLIQLHKIIESLSQEKLDSFFSEILSIVIYSSPQQKTTGWHKDPECPDIWLSGDGEIGINISKTMLTFKMEAVKPLPSNVTELNEYQRLFGKKILQGSCGKEGQFFSEYSIVGFPYTLNLYSSFFKIQQNSFQTQLERDVYFMNFNQSDMATAFPEGTWASGLLRELSEHLSREKIYQYHIQIEQCDANPDERESVRCYILQKKEDRADFCTRKVAIFRRYPLGVEVYNFVDVGAHLAEKLIYKSDGHFTLENLEQRAAKSKRPLLWHYHERFETGFSFTPYENRKTLIITKGSSSSPEEILVLPDALSNVLPACLVEAFNFWRKCNTSDFTLMTSISKLSPYKLNYSLQVTGEKYGEQDVLRVIRMPNDKDDSKYMLINFANAPVSSEIRMLGSLLTRLDNASHILMWTRQIDASWGDNVSIDLIEFPRLKLSFAVRMMNDIIQIESLDFSGLFIIQGDPPSTIKQIQETLPPNYIIMQNDKMEYFVLVSSCPITLPLMSHSPLHSFPISMRNNQEWLSNCTSRVFLFPIHVSQKYIHATSPASTLYLALMYMCTFHFGEAYRVLSSCVIDKAMNSDEQYVRNLYEDILQPYPDMISCYLKMLFCTEGFTKDKENLLSIGGEAIGRARHISKECQLTIEEIKFLNENSTEIQDFFERLGKSKSIQYEQSTVQQYHSRLSRVARDLFGNGSFYCCWDGTYTYVPPPSSIMNDEEVVNCISDLSQDVISGSAKKLGFIFFYQCIAGRITLRLNGKDETLNILEFQLRQLLFHTDFKKHNYSMDLDPNPVTTLYALVYARKYLNLPVDKIPNINLDDPVVKDSWKQQVSARYTKFITFTTNMQKLLEEEARKYYKKIGEEKYCPQILKTSKAMATISSNVIDTFKGFVSSSCKRQKWKIDLANIDVDFTSGHGSLLEQPMSNIIDISQYITTMKQTKNASDKIPFDISHKSESKRYIGKEIMERWELEVKTHSSELSDEVTMIQHTTFSSTYDKAIPLLLDLSGKLHNIYTGELQFWNTLLDKILLLANTVNSTEKGFEIILKKTAHQVVTLEIDTIIPLLLSEESESDLLKLNSCLSLGDAKLILNNTCAYLLGINRIGQIGRIISTSNSLISKLNSFKKLDGITNQKRIELVTSIEKESIFLAEALQASRYYVNIKEYEFNPRFLIFEFNTNIMLRKMQVVMMENFLQKIKQNTCPAAVQQMIMGAGKTTVISPLLAMCLADMEHLVLQIVPGALLEMTRNVIRTPFIRNVMKRVFTMEYERGGGLKEITILERKLEFAKKHADIVVSTPEAVKSLFLKYIELVIKSIQKEATGTEEDQIEKLKRVLKLWKSASVIMDEVDLILHPLKSELNFPIGEKENLDLGSDRWDLSLHLIDAMLYPETKTSNMPLFEHSNYSLELLKKLERVTTKGFEILALQRVPHLIILDETYYHSEIKPILAELSISWLTSRHLLSSGIQENLISAYISNTKLEEEIGEGVEKKLSKHQMKLANHTRNIIQTFIPYIFSKFNRVSYGLLSEVQIKEGEKNKSSKSRESTAVPFIGKDVPSRNSEFAHPDVMIGLTILAYRYEGLRQNDVIRIVKLLQNKMKIETGPINNRPTTRLFDNWLQKEKCKLEASGKDTSDVAKIPPLPIIHIDEQDHLNYILRVLKYSASAIEYYLNAVFSDVTPHNSFKLSSCGQELGGDLLFKTRLGFSGTPNSLLPVEMGKCIHQPGTDGAMLDTLSSPTVVSYSFITHGWTVGSILKQVANSSASALIDTGALITGYSNDQVARFLLENGLQHKRGAVFLNEHDQQMILLRNPDGSIADPILLSECGISNTERFTFYDQVHTTGIDIKQAINAQAILTLGKDMTFRDYAQGAYRMRGIGNGQTIHLYILPEVSKLVCSTLENIDPLESLPPDRVVSVICGWLTVNSIKSEEKQFMQLLEQDTYNIWRKAAHKRMLQYDTPKKNTATTERKKTPSNLNQTSSAQKKPQSRSVSRNSRIPSYMQPKRTTLSAASKSAKQTTNRNSRNVTSKISTTAKIKKKIAPKSSLNKAPLQQKRDNVRKDTTSSKAIVEQKGENPSKVKPNDCPSPLESNQEAEIQPRVSVEDVVQVPFKKCSDVFMQTVDFCVPSKAPQRVILTERLKDINERYREFQGNSEQIKKDITYILELAIQSTNLPCEENGFEQEQEKQMEVEQEQEQEQQKEKQIVSHYIRGDEVNKPWPLSTLFSSKWKSEIYPWNNVEFGNEVPNILPRNLLLTENFFKNKGSGNLSSKKMKNTLLFVDFVASELSKSISKGNINSSDSGFEENDKYLEAAFSLFDVNNSGNVVLEEIQHVLLGMNLRVAPQKNSKYITIEDLKEELLRDSQQTSVNIGGDFISINMSLSECESIKYLMDTGLVPLFENHSIAIRFLEGRNAASSILSCTQPYMGLIEDRHKQLQVVSKCLRFINNDMSFERHEVPSLMRLFKDAKPEERKNYFYRLILLRRREQKKCTMDSAIFKLFSLKNEYHWLYRNALIYRLGYEIDVSGLQLQDAVSKFDKNKSSSLSAEELHRLFQHVKLDKICSLKDCKELVAEADISNDGNIDLSELQYVMASLSHNLQDDSNTNLNHEIISLKPQKMRITMKKKPSK